MKPTICFPAFLIAFTATTCLCENLGTIELPDDSLWKKTSLEWSSNDTTYFVRLQFEPRFQITNSISAHSEKIPSAQVWLLVPDGSVVPYQKTMPFRAGRSDAYPQILFPYTKSATTNAAAIVLRLKDKYYSFPLPTKLQK
jgi:hypothetical protein